VVPQGFSAVSGFRARAGGFSASVGGFRVRGSGRVLRPCRRASNRSGKEIKDRRGTGRPEAAAAQRQMAKVLTFVRLPVPMSTGTAAWPTVGHRREVSSFPPSSIHSSTHSEFLTRTSITQRDKQGRGAERTTRPPPFPTSGFAPFAFKNLTQLLRMTQTSGEGERGPAGGGLPYERREQPR
jgi:hypothetical protein